MTCSNKEVADYLRNNPDFFDHHLELLADLDIPHGAGNAVSLIERQVAVLRQDNKQLRGRIRELVEIARDNENLIAKLHRISIDLVEAPDVDNYIDVITAGVRKEFNADSVSLRLFSDAVDCNRSEVIASDSAGVKLFSSILSRGKPVCGRFNDQQLQVLFPDQNGSIESLAVIPLCAEKPLGLLAIGSRDPGRFRAGMSTSFLAYLGEIAVAVLKGYTVGVPDDASVV